MNETYWIIAIVVLEKKSQSYHFYQIIFINASIILIFSANSNEMMLIL